MDNKARLAAMQQQRAKALARQQAAAQRAQPAAIAVAAAGAPVVPPVPIAQARAVAAQPPPSMTRGGQSDAPSMNRGGGQSDAAAIADQRRRSGEGLPATGSAPSGYAQQASGSQQSVALEAAKREVAEEMGLVSGRWRKLGEFRTAVNRGGGTIHCFLAEEAVALPRTASSRAGHDDLERMDMVFLDEAELRAELLSGNFAEVKWTATISLALLSMGVAEPPITQLKVNQG